MRIAVYTALFGHRGRIWPSRWLRNDVEYFCFTDREEVPPPWVKLPLGDTLSTPVLTAKQYKIFPDKFLPHHTMSIWVDANFEITTGFTDPLKKILWDDWSPPKNFTGVNLYCFRHFERDCLYDEARVCIESGRDSAQVIQAQISRYKAERFPEHAGLAENGVLFRRSGCEDVQDTMSLWWEEITRGSIRDQLSFMYCVWKKRPAAFMDIHTLRDGRFHTWHDHNE